MLWSFGDEWRIGGAEGEPGESGEVLGRNSQATRTLLRLEWAG
jgi:hypothetical protein